MSAIKKITERVNRNGDINDKNTLIPLLTLNEFFEENDVVGSIGCNLDGVPQPSQFYSLFQSLEKKPSVKRIYVQITMFDDPDWPFSDTVWFITTSSTDEVAAWFSNDLAPNEVWEGWVESQNYEKIEIPEGYKAIACWWD